MWCLRRGVGARQPDVSCTVRSPESNGLSDNRTSGCLAPTFALRLRPYSRRAAPRQPFVLSLSKDEQRQHPFHSHYGLTPVSLASFSALNSASDVYHFDARARGVLRLQAADALDLER